MWLRVLMVAMLALTSCATFSSAAPWLGLAASSAGHSAGLVLAVGGDQVVDTLAECLALSLVADVGPLAGQVLATEGQVYGPASGSVARCIDRFGLPAVDLDVELERHLDGLLANAGLLVSSLTRKCEARGRWEGFALFARAALPSVLEAARSGSGRWEIGRVEAPSTCAAPDQAQRVARAATRAREQLVLAGLR